MAKSIKCGNLLCLTWEHHLESFVALKILLHPAAVALGRMGGLKGGKARAERLTPEERSAIAKKAAQDRWNRSKD
jgi:hypothetical protein